MGAASYVTMRELYRLLGRWSSKTSKILLHTGTAHSIGPVWAKIPTVEAAYQVWGIGMAWHQQSTDQKS
jgi:hypothetical protein